MHQAGLLVVPHSPRPAHLIRTVILHNCMGGRVAPARHGLVSIVTARCRLRCMHAWATSEPCFADKKARVPSGCSAACLAVASYSYEDQQKMAESLNRRKSIFLSHYECMRVAPLVRITLGSMKRSSPRLRSWSELSALGRYGPWRPPKVRKSVRNPYAPILIDIHIRFV